MAYQAQLKDPKPMRDLIQQAPEQDIEAEQADPDANVSGAMPLAQQANEDLPDARTVQSQETVQGQITDLLDSDNRYIQRAREQGKQFASERGLLNTSIAAQSGEAAAIDAALPIASQDAQAHERAARQYQGHLERLIQRANAGDVQAQHMLQQAGYNEQLSAAENARRVIEMAMQGDVQARLQLQQAGQESELSKQAFGQQSELSRQEFGQRGELLSQEHQQRLVELAKQGDVEARLQLERHRQSLEQLAKQGDIEAELQLERHQQSLVEMAKQGDIQAGLQAAEFSHDKIMEDIAQGHRIELSDVNFQQELDVMETQLQHSQVLNAQEAQLWRQNQELVHQQTLDQINEKAGITAERDERLADLEREEQRLREQFAGDQASLDRELERLRIERSTLQNREAQAGALQSQYLADVSRMHQQTAANVTNIYSTEGLTPQQQQNAAAAEWNRLESQLDAIAAQYQGSDLWDPNWAQSSPSSYKDDGWPDTVVY